MQMTTVGNIFLADQDPRCGMAATICGIGPPKFESNTKLSGWWFGTCFVIFPLTNSIIFQDGYCTTNQLWLGVSPISWM